MAEGRRRRRIALALGAGAVCAAGCLSGLDYRHPSGARLLDKSCGDGQCTTIGSARRTTGPTSDSIGFHLGPGGGTVTIPLASVTRAGDDGASIEVLIEGHGTMYASRENPCTAGCVTQTITIPGTYDWVFVAQGNSPDDAGTFSGNVLSLTIENDGSSLDLADVRLVTTPPIDCSVGRVTGR